MAYDRDQYHNDLAAERDYNASRCCVRCWRELFDGDDYCRCGRAALRGHLDDYTVECECCGLEFRGQVGWVWTAYSVEFPDDLWADITCPACKEESE